MAKIRFTPSIFCAAGILLCFGAQAASLLTQSEVQWIEQTEQQAIEDGVTSETAHAALDGFVPNPRVVELDQKQPETTVTFDTYRSNTVTRARVKKGAELMSRYADQLDAIEARTGVPAQVTVALWGIESSFGQNIGGFETINSLATLAYEGRRADFFRTELFAALHIIDQEHMNIPDLRGSWAGAMGQCQFMPSTYLKYALDGDGDGRRDIWNNSVDALASIANYLSAEGWQSDLTWGREVEANGIDASEVGLTQTHSLQEWADKGVTNSDGSPLPHRDLQASLIKPDGAEGASFLVYENFRALMRWNRSTYFATSVGLLADAIKQN